MKYAIIDGETLVSATSCQQIREMFADCWIRWVNRETWLKWGK